MARRNGWDHPAAAQPYWLARKGGNPPATAKPNGLARMDRPATSRMPRATVTTYQSNCPRIWRRLPNWRGRICTRW
jgi:hypothetical protein